LVGKPEGKRPLVTPRRRLEDNIRMDLREIGREVVDWRHMIEVRHKWRVLVNTVNEPSSSRRGRKFLDYLTISFSRTMLHVVS
jgi:ribosome biogenesis protein Nip4